MNARELLDLYTRNGIEVIEESRDGPTILRALALLAAVDESSDGLVRDWLESQDFYELCQNYRHAPDMMKREGQDNAAEAFERLKREIGQRHAARIVALEAELASVKAERDAMLHDLETSEGLMCCDNHEGHSLFELKHPSAEAYRAAKPKDTP